MAHADNNNNTVARPLRSLLPSEPGRPRHGAGHADASEQSAKASSSRSKIERIKSACNLCKERKIKCSGDRPRCASCTRRNRKCVYFTTNSNETRAEVVKRAIDDRLHESQAYKELYELLRERPEPEAQHLLQRIRLGSDAKTLLRQVKEGDVLLQVALTPETRFRYTFPYHAEWPSHFARHDNPYLGSMIYEAIILPEEFEPEDQVYQAKPQYLSPYHASTVAHPLLSNVAVSKWTAVTSNDQLLRTLLQAYMHHEYALHPVVHMDIFLESMVEDNSDFCSPLLVSALMASACRCCPEVPLREQFWNPRSLVFRFLAEATMLWGLQTEEPTLTTLQAALLLHITYSSHAMEEVMRPYLTQAIIMAQKLKLFEGHDDSMSSEMKHAREFTAWSLFQWQSIFGYYHACPAPLRDPPRYALPNPDHEPAWYGDIGLRYPLVASFTPVHIGHTFKAISELRVIVNHLSFAMFGNNGTQVERQQRNRITNAELRTYLTRLQEWYDKLGEPLQPKNIVLPSQMNVHLEFYSVVFNLLQTIERSNGSAALNIILPTGLCCVSSQEAAVRFETVVRLYYLRHGFSFYNSWLCHNLVFISNLTLQYLETNTALTENDDRRKAAISTLVMAVKGLYEQSRHYYVCAVTFYLLRARLSARQRAILETYLSLDDMNAVPKSLPHAVHSTWPLTIITADEEPSVSQIKNLVKKLEI